MPQWTIWPVFKNFSIKFFKIVRLPLWQKIQMFSAAFAVKQINCALYEMPKLARFTFANFDSAINLVNPHST